LKRAEAVVGLVLLAAAPGSVWAEGSSTTVSPYIDEIQKELKAKDAAEGRTDSSEGYSQRVKKQLKKTQEEETGKTYIQELQEENPALKEPEPSNGYSAGEALKLPPQKQGGAIEAVAKGESALHPKMRGDITGAFGFKMGTAMKRNIDGGDLQARPFEDVYGSGFAPEVKLFYEYQPWHSETWGNFGLVGSFGVSYFNGFGQFKKQLINAATGQPFPLESETRFQFFEIPVFFALDYRMNIGHFLRPFVMAGPMAIGYTESRNDDQGGSHGFSKCIYGAAGVAILLDGLSSDSSWELYSAFHVRHYYLTIEYSRTHTISSQVSFDVSGVDAGLTFEF
jgi:hypothetical protein